MNLAKENKLTESFLWIPSLEGPTFDSPPTEMMSWLKDWSGASKGPLLNFSNVRWEAGCSHDFFQTSRVFLSRVGCRVAEGRLGKRGSAGTGESFSPLRLSLSGLVLGSVASVFPWLWQQLLMIKY